MKSHDLLLLVFSFFSEALGTISGFGSSTFFVPLAVSIESFGFVLVLTAILHCFGNISKIYLFRENFPKILILQLGLPSVVFTGIGALLSSRFSSDLLMRLLGMVLVIISAVKILQKSRITHLHSKASIVLCGVSGFLTGLVGTGGAIRGMALTMLQLEKHSFIVLSAGIDLGGDLLRAGIYLSQGKMDWNQWFYIPLLGVTAALGAITGKRILTHINQKQFEKIVAVFVFFSGLTMIFGIYH